MQNSLFLILFSLSNSSSSGENSFQSLRRNKRGHGGEVPYDHPIFSVKEEHVPYLSEGDLDDFSQFAESYPDVELPEALEDAIADFNDGIIEFVPLKFWEDVEAALQVYNDNPNLEPQPHIFPYFDSIFYITEEELNQLPQEDLDSIQQFFLENPHLIAPPHIIQFFNSTTTSTTTTPTREVPSDHPIFSVKEEHVPYLSEGDLDDFSQFAESYPDVELPEALEDAIADFDDYGDVEYAPLENWEDVKRALQVYNDNPNLEPQPHIYPYFDSMVFFITEEELHEFPQEGLDYIQEFFLENPDLIKPPHIIEFFSSTTIPTTTTIPAPEFLMENTPPHLNPDYDPESNDEESSNDEEAFEVWTVPREDVQFILENTPPRMASTTSTTIPPQTSTTTTRESVTNFAMQNTPPHLNPTSTTTTYSTPQFIMENTPPALSNENQAISSTTQSSTPVASGVNTDPPANDGAQGVSSTPASVSQVSQCKITFIIITLNSSLKGE